MSWNYSGDPSSSDRDETRFHIGDTDCNDKLVSDEEIDFALSSQSAPRLAAAICLRHLATKFSRMVTHKVGDISTNYSDLAKQYAARAKELDPAGVSAASVNAVPIFGGISNAQKQVYADDTDAVKPSFYKGAGDIPGGPSEFLSNYDEE